MKIAVIDPWCFSPPYDRELCDGLSSLGHDVTLIGQSKMSDHEGIDHASTGFTYLDVFKAPPDQLPRILLLVLKGGCHIAGMLRTFFLLHRLRPDVIHIQWLALPLIDAFFVPLLRRIAPVVLTVHDSNPYNGAGPLLLRLGHMMAIRRFDRWIVHNEISSQHLVERGLDSNRVHRVAHGLLNPVESGGESKRSRKRDGSVHFLQFGKLKDYKGADIFLDAVSRLNEAERSCCRVSIVGRPYMETQALEDQVMRHRLEEVVELRFDFVSDDEMAALFDEADFLVFPYRAIDTSGVLMAAISRGIPVVASNIGCFAEMITDGEEGSLVPPNDSECLANALSSLIQNPSKVEAMRDNMIALRQRIPSWQGIAETTTKVYELAQAPPAPKPVGAHT
jgi:glycosyltransferase involved in cell wall biosynthesis